MGSDFSQDVASIRVDNKWGYINKDGKLVIDYLYDKAKSFKEGLAPVCINNKWGYIDLKGNVVIDFQYEYAC